MSNPVLADGWESIRSQGRVVYYSRTIDELHRLAVSKDDDTWTWRHYARKSPAHEWKVALAGKGWRTAAQARRHADRIMSPLEEPS